MRLKEKLAKEYQETRFQGLGSFTDQEAPYLAGFEKAREMALKEVFDSHAPEVGISMLGEEEV